MIRGMCCDLTECPHVCVTYNDDVYVLSSANKPKIITFACVLRCLRYISNSKVILGTRLESRRLIQLTGKLLSLNSMNYAGFIYIILCVCVCVC